MQPTTSVSIKGRDGVEDEDIIDGGDGRSAATCLSARPFRSTKEALVNTIVEMLTMEEAARMDSNNNKDKHDDHDNNKEEGEQGWTGAAVPR
jgi:hypothetical protein